MTSQFQKFGAIQEIDIQEDRREGVIILSGIMESGAAVEVRLLLSGYTAQQLWQQLTQILYPSEAPTMTDAPPQIPSRTEDGRPLTRQINIKALENGDFEVLGEMASGTWSIVLDENRARRVWAKLDVTLFPVGWQGRTSQNDDFAST